ncbi:thiol reductant ABC exporter subunit CydD [Oxalicibacterium flavum]|uniref:Thiol reductant ABC exporter subunit CydD n=1 Tax=Oxalicibacterium flavum TaxID=179467 RepID=A0A8J2XXN7_9BURK|nr:thiol reductant ABC exporter subunit CydD [Oxalicibacterium flavum]
MQTAGSLLWIPQAALLAWSLQSLTDGGGMRSVVLPALAVFMLGVLRAVCEMAGTRLTFKRARAHLSKIRAVLADSLAMRSPLDPQRPASGLAASAMAEQAEAILPYLARYQPARMRATLVPLFILSAVFSVSWLAGLILLVAAPLIPIFMALVGWRAKAASEAQMSEIGGMNGFLLDRLRGLTTIRSLQAVDLTANRLQSAAHALRRRTMAVLRIAFLSSAVLELFAALGVAMVAVYIGFHLLGQLNFGAWSGKLSLGQGLFVLLLAPSFFEPLRELSAVWHDRAAGEAALEQIERLTRQGMPLPEAGLHAVGQTSARHDAMRAPTIAVRNLHFSYPDSGHAVFAGLNLHIERGEHVAIVAPSGAGKSTLLSLMAGMASPQQGDIVIGDCRLQADTAAALRARMAWIGQKPHVFAGSVRSNVTLGRAGMDSGDVELALRLAALHKVRQAQAGVMLAEMGGGLSGGEAVRLALARAAAHPHADILLVDEPTAHLDRDTAEEVMRALLHLAQGRTMAVATHDMALVQRLDRSIVLGEREKVRA